MQPIPDPKFCVQCGKALEARVPRGDHRPRKVCPACGFIHYVQPKIAAGAVVEHDGRLILIKRNVEPRIGFWSFPCGFVEADETLEEGARRETLEEVGLDVELAGHLGTYSYPQSWHGGTVVVVVYRARSVGGAPKAGDDAEEVRLVAPSEIPWNDLAFDSSHAALRDWLRVAGGGVL
jgi:ADP-ribose pyrophosphatase YjhB (NUDIX family)